MNDHNFSIVVPTFQEAQNINEFIQRITQIGFKSDSFELIFVDDNSQDGIVELIKNLQPSYPWIKLIVRYQNKGLSASVIDGIKQAAYANIVVMDADLSHPPEKIPEMLFLLQHEQLDMVIGSRYVPGGQIDDDCFFIRKWLSRIAAGLVKILIINNINDPFSGFFAIRKKSSNAIEKLDPIGWKIMLEIIIKWDYTRIKEIPIYFGRRRKGKSKLCFKTMLSILIHFKKLVTEKKS